MPLTTYDAVALCASGHTDWTACTPPLRAAAEPRDLEPMEPPRDNILLVAFHLLQQFIHADEPRALYALFFSLCLSHLEHELLPPSNPSSGDEDDLAELFGFLRFPPLLDLLVEGSRSPSDDAAFAWCFNDLVDLLAVYTSNSPSPLIHGVSSYASVVQRKSLFLYATNTADVETTLLPELDAVLWDLQISSAAMSVLIILLQVFDVAAQKEFIQLANSCKSDAIKLLRDVQSVYNVDHLLGPACTACTSTRSLELGFFYDQSLALVERFSADKHQQAVLLAFFACAIHEASPMHSFSPQDLTVLLVETAQVRNNVLVDKPKILPSLSPHLAAITLFVVNRATPPARCVRLVPTVYNGIRMLQTQVWKTSFKFHFVFSSPSAPPFDLTRISLCNGTSWSGQMSAFLVKDQNFLRYFSSISHSEFEANTECFVLLSCNFDFHRRASAKVEEMLSRLGVSSTALYHRQFKM